MAPRHLMSPLDFSVDELEAHLRKKDGQRNAWKTAAGAQVEHLCAAPEIHRHGDGHGVQHMVLI